MRMSDLVLFGPPFLLVGFGWVVLMLSERSDRRIAERARRPGAAE